MIVDAPTPCFGESALFDSTHPGDHALAKALCDTCPALAACKDHLRATRQAAHPGAGPEGTWAGHLLTNRPPRQTRYTPAEIAAQDAAYTDEEMREANAQFKTGVRTEWVLTGHRAYERNRKRRQKKAA